MFVIKSRFLKKKKTIMPNAQCQTSGKMLFQNIKSHGDWFLYGKCSRMIIEYWVSSLGCRIHKNKLNAMKAFVSKTIHGYIFFCNCALKTCAAQILKRSNYAMIFMGIQLNVHQGNRIFICVLFTLGCYIM